MNLENTKKLMGHFPQIFCDRDKSVQESLIPFGLECGDGWFDLIYKMCEDIMKCNPHEEFKATQVKEKFGTLRFYVTSASDKIWDIIEKAEDDSANICETCGTRKEVTTENWGWVITACRVCRVNREEYLVMRNSGTKARPTLTLLNKK